MTLPHILILFKSLPSCPVGTKFYLSLDNKFYFNESSNDIKDYIFTIDEVLKSLSTNVTESFFTTIVTYAAYNNHHTTHCNISHERFLKHIADNWSWSNL